MAQTIASISPDVDEQPRTQRTGHTLIERAGALRRDAAKRIQHSQQSALGQFLTPLPIARLMASMLTSDGPTVHLLDAGAGSGMLFAAAIAELLTRPRPPDHIHVTAYEVDAGLATYARRTLELCGTACMAQGVDFQGTIIEADFLEAAVYRTHGSLFDPEPEHALFDCAILNPPYRKIHSQSRHRRLLRQLGIETSNLYTGFLAATMPLLAPTGEMIAITPRSFCNGPYFTSFRKSLLRTMRLRHLHVFESRQDAFSDDDVLQENVILCAAKGSLAPSVVRVTSSRGADDELVLSREVPYERVVDEGDPHAFIHIVADELGERMTQRLSAFTCSLADLGLTVSTGRVVDFRVREFLRAGAEPGTVPLVYPVHFASGYVEWPQPDSRKPNALVLVEKTWPQVVPNEHYVLVRRFSAKEERRRLVAAIYDADRIPCESVGFENHLNYFHSNGRGLDMPLARGLAAYLNSTLLDEHFRQFSGHTQVNATDLRSLRYPTAEALRRLGMRVGEVVPAQEAVDALVQEELIGMAEAPDVDPVLAKQRIDEARQVLAQLGFPRAQQNERSALTLLALLGLSPATPWAEASKPLLGITPMMDFFRAHFGKDYAPNSRETVRRQTVHQFLAAALIVINPDKPDRPTNSGDTVYQIEGDALALLRTFATEQWPVRLAAYKARVETVQERHARERERSRIPITATPGKTLSLSPGGQNPLVKQIIEEFLPRFAPGAVALYVGDTGNKFSFFDTETLAGLGIEIEPHGKIPDLIAYDERNIRLLLIEAVTSHGPIDQKRKDDLEGLFGSSTAEPIFVTAFMDRKTMAKYLSQIAWETEMWAADSPDHMIHFNGERFLSTEGTGSDGD